MDYLLKKYLRGRKVTKITFALFLIIIFQIVSLYQLYSEDAIEYIEEIDIVYTWVNGSDEKFIETIKKYEINIELEKYKSNDELKYSLRSLEVNAPWFRHVYIVTNGQVPSWLNLEYEKVSVIPHQQLVKEPGILPTFSSNVIEQFLHLIPNLSKRFLYINDDVYVGADLYPEDLYTTDRGFHVYTTSDPPNCAPLCPWAHLKDDICDKECNVAECEFDGNDCVEGNMHRKIPYNAKYGMYMRSVINSNKMFSLVYGLKKRYILPHSGFLFDKDIMKDMFVKFRKEFNKTRYNRFETVDDVQVPYSFFHYLMSEKRNLSVDEIFDRFDSDKSETWSDNEISTVLEDLYWEPVNTATSAEYFESLLLNCSGEEIDSKELKDKFYKMSNNGKITRNLVTKCSSLTEILVNRFSIENKYKFEITSQRAYINTFVILSSNISVVTNILNQLRKYPKKFTCVDVRQDENSAAEQRLKIKEAIDDFYMMIFPYHSKFELPDSVLNPFHYYDDYLKWKTKERFRSIFSGTNIFGALIICLFLLYCYRKMKYSRK